MEVGGTANVRGLVVVTTTVTGGVLVIDLRGSVKRLVNIGDQVNNHTHSERLGIRRVGVVQQNVIGVDGVISAWHVLEPVSQTLESVNNISVGHLVVGVVRERVTLAEVGLVNVMPLGSPPVTFTLDVVGPGGALSEGMVVLLSNDIGIVFSKDGKLVESPLQDSRVLGLENSFSLTGD